MYRILVISVLSFCSVAFAQSELSEKPQKAHVHGQGSASLAFDGKKGRLEMSLPADVVMGFEHRPKSAKDRKAKEDSLLKLEEKISDMVALDPSLKCEIKKEIFEVIESKDHGDVEAEFNITCEQPVVGSTIKFNFAKTFPRMKKIKVDVIAGEVQKSVEVKKGGESLELK
ncbi:hypothetical protein D3C87_1291700 [compost metagenome]